MDFEDSPLRRVYCAIKRNTVVLVAFVLGAALAAVLEANLVVMSTTGTTVSQHSKEVAPAPLPTEAPAVEIPYTNDHEEEPPIVDRHWCPRASCPTNLHCRPCQRRFLIIIATGRSASTTLTRMMGSLPGVRMAGENNGAILHIENLWNAIIRHPFKLELEEGKLDGAWGHNPIHDGSVACIAQSVIETINPPPETKNVNSTIDEQDMIIGFKTVRLHNRWNDAAHDHVVSTAKTLHQFFPCARYLVNIRSDHRAHATSVKTSFNVKEKSLDMVMEQVTTDAERLTTLAKLLDEHAILLDSTEWTKNVTKLNDAVEWLGFHPSCAFNQLLEFNTGRNHKTPPSRTLALTQAQTHQFKRTAPPPQTLRKPPNRHVGTRRRAPPSSGRLGGGHNNGGQGGHHNAAPKQGPYSHGRTKLELNDTCRYLPDDFDQVDDGPDG